MPRSTPPVCPIFLPRPFFIIATSTLEY
jgi:hypothetical protein